jgi:uncharacterized protein involved in exopolysaccharide biosynthesis
MPRALKVYRTAIGFHDAYVAAPSKKAALAAWGAQKDLFAIGAAEPVTDAALTKEPLASPGQVIRRSRGGLAEQLAAMPERTPAPKTATKAAPARKPKPKPRRDKLDEAEAALQELTTKAEAEVAALREQEEQLRREREALESRQAAETRALKQKVARARERYESALAKWRETL